MRTSLKSTEIINPRPPPNINLTAEYFPKQTAFVQHHLTQFTAHYTHTKKKNLIRNKNNNVLLLKGIS